MGLVWMSLIASLNIGWIKMKKLFQQKSKISNKIAYLTAIMDIENNY